MKLATLCYVRRGNQTLMLHRVKKENDIHEGKYNGLGGKLEAGESPEECAIREVYEESGLVVEDLRLCGLLTFPQFSAGEDWYVYLFEITKFSGELIDCPEGNLEWVDSDRLTDLPLWEGDRHFLKWLAEGRFFSAKFVYQNKKLTDHSVAFYSC